jgi:hypothetical protein
MNIKILIDEDHLPNLSEEIKKVVFIEPNFSSISTLKGNKKLLEQIFQNEKKESLNLY